MLDMYGVRVLRIARTYYNVSDGTIQSLREPVEGSGNTYLPHPRYYLKYEYTWDHESSLIV